MKMKIAGAVLAAAVAGALFAGQAAAATQTVGVIQLVEHSALDAANRGIVDQMKARGMDVKFDQQNAQADQSNLHNIAQRFVTQKYPLIFAIATPAAQSVANATSKTPIVATAVTDFAVARLVKTNELPGTNVTGSSDMNPVAAQLDLLLKFVPNAKTIGTIYNSSEINSQFQIDILKKAVARKSGLKLIEVTISNVNDVQQAAQSLIGKIDALYLPTDNVIASAVPVLTRITNRARLPIIAGEEGMIRAGALATLGVDYYELGKIAGNMGADILEGKARPETMPIRFQKTFKAKINSDTVKRIRIKVPEDVAKTAEFVTTSR
jgi:putative ABC transport system substrate-binding protein